MPHRVAHLVEHCAQIFYQPIDIVQDLIALLDLRARDLDLREDLIRISTKLT